MNEQENKIRIVLDKVWKEMNGLTVGEISAIINAVQGQVNNMKIVNTPQTTTEEKPKEKK